MERRKIQKGQVDDLVLLDDFSESAIVANLQNTSKADIIYVDWAALVSRISFKQISCPYTLELIRKYRGRYSWSSHRTYAVAEDTYRALMSSHKSMHPHHR